MGRPGYGSGRNCNGPGAGPNRRIAESCAFRGETVAPLSKPSGLRSRRLATRFAASSHRLAAACMPATARAAYILRHLSKLSRFG
ncbi:hypothetical protein LC55x_4869 [Lysobacter capsici]|nr:hypothetical protein LC55x_4869 [Lysobacter capsici]